MKNEVLACSKRSDEYCVILNLVSESNDKIKSSLNDSHNHYCPSTVSVWIWLRWNIEIYIHWPVAAKFIVSTNCKGNENEITIPMIAVIKLLYYFIWFYYEVDNR